MQRAALKRGLGRAAIGDIKDDLPISAQLSIRIAQGGDRHIGKIFRAVLPPQPGFLLYSLNLRGADEIGGGLVARHVARRVEDQSGLTDRLISGPSSQQNRTAIPCLDRAARIQEKHGPIDRTLGKQRE